MEKNDSGSILFVIGLSLVAALGGLLFSYDTAFVSVAIGFLQAHFKLSATMKGSTAFSALVGCVLGVLMAGFISNRFGRKNTLILSAILFLISAIGTTLPKSLLTFVIYRIIGGLKVGAASMTSPMYIATLNQVF